MVHNGIYSLGIVVPGSSSSSEYDRRVGNIQVSYRYVETVRLHVCMGTYSLVLSVYCVREQVGRSSLLTIYLLRY